MVKNLASYIRKWASEEPHRIVFKEYRDEEWKSVSYSNYWQKAQTLAKSLIERGYTETIGSVGLNSANWNVLDLATDILGSTHASFFPSFESKTVRNIIQSSQMQVLFVPSENWIPIFTPLISEFNDKLKIEVMEFEVYEEEKTHAISVLEDVNPSNREDCTTLLFTSGTTTNSGSKTVIHRTSSLIEYAMSLAPIYNLNQDDVALSFLPISHGFERCHNYYCQIEGITISYASNILSVSENMRASKATFVSTVPKLAEQIRDVISKAEDRHKALPPIKYVASSGASMPNSLRLFFKNRGISVIESYGLTECLGVSSCTIKDENISGVGIPLPHVDVKIVKNKVFVKSRTMFDGYLTKYGVELSVDEQGYFETGDVGEISEGRLTVNGREGDIFKRLNGRFFDPRKVEEDVLAQTEKNAQVILVEDKQGALVLVFQQNIVDAKTKMRVNLYTDKYNNTCKELERINKVIFVSENWSSESGHLTHNGKLKKQYVRQLYGSK